MSAVTVFHVEDGAPDAPPVLLSGPLGSTAEVWEPQVAALVEHFRVIRYDTRGHGRSPVPPGSYTLDDLAEDAVALLDRLHIDRCHVVGLSLGGLTAMRLAARHPDRVDRLALLCTPALPGAAGFWAGRAAAVRAEGTDGVATAGVARWFTPALQERDPALVEAMREMIAATPAEGYAACCDALEGHNPEPDLLAIVAPTLALVASQDAAVPPDHLDVVVKALPEATTEEVADGAHLVSAEQPGVVNRALLAHLLE